MGRPKGYTMSEETKNKIRLRKLGKMFTEEHKKHMSESAKNRISKLLNIRVVEMVTTKALRTLAKYAVTYGVDSPEYKDKEKYYIEKGYLCPEYDREKVKQLVDQLPENVKQQMSRVFQMARQKSLNTLYRYAFEYGTGSDIYKKKETECLDKGYLDKQIDPNVVWEKGKQIVELDEKKAEEAYKKLINEYTLPKVELEPLSKMDPEKKKRLWEYVKKHW